jgi:hypothetical protein
MHRIDRLVKALLGSLCAALVACGGSGGGSGSPPPPTTYVLTVDSTTPASGVAITVSPADVNGSASGTTSFTRTYDAGTTVTLTAPATSGTNTFSSWTGCTSTSGASCTVSMNGNVTATANYAAPPPVTYTLTVNSTNPTSGVQVTVSPADDNQQTTGATSTTSPLTFTYNSGTAVTISVPGTNGTHTFSNFSGVSCTSMTGGAGAASTCTLTISANTVVTANYGFNVSVDSTNPVSGVGITLSASPFVPLQQLLTTPATVGNVGPGSQLVFSAPATAGGNSFASWTGCTTVAGTTCNLTVAADSTITANYTPTYTLTVDSTNPATGVSIGVSPNDVNGSGAGTTSFTRSYSSGAAVTLTAPATVGTGATATTFSNWTGCTSANGTTCNVTMSAAATVTANYTLTPIYTLSVVATGVPAAVAMTISPADVNGNSSGNTIVTRKYTSGTAVTVTAPATTGSGNATASFGSWTGCTSATTETCNVTMNANTTVTAAYTANLVTISPSTAAATIGSTVQFSAVVTDPATTSQAVTWSVSAPAGSTASAGDITAAGLYTTPYPAPATVTVTATSVGDPKASASAVVTLSAPAASTGPALSVDAGNQTHAISPLIYGMNNYQLEAATTTAAGITVDRFGGDATTRYNYLLDVSSSAADYYFANFTGATGVEATGQFNQQFESDKAAGVKTLGTVNVMGYVAKDGTSCTWPIATYPNQYANDGTCGDGESASQVDLTPPAPTTTSIAVGPTFAGNWVSYLVSKFGSAANGGVPMYDLDNEPEYWVDVHRDVHPLPATYDEMTNNGIATAEAIKTADPTAEVSGPIVSGWFDYFYSAKDVASGYSTGPCYQPWQNPIDRQAHSGIPFIEYYLQQMSAASTTYGARLLDYLDIHAYYAADYPTGTQNSTGLTTAGDTGAQQARLNSTRVFWDPTYTDPNEPQPNYLTDSNYTASCSVPLQSPQLIPMLKTWIANNYPGTKTSIDEYNWGGQENINGAVAQADILGIFGREGLDMGALWGPPNPTTQVPGLVAFEVYRNYDGAGAKFGDMALASTSGNQGQLAVYGAQRTSDGAVTIVVLNKTYGNLTSTLSLPNLTATGQAQVYLYSAANLAGLVTQPAITVTAPPNGSTTSSLSTTFPGQSITLMVIPTK